MKALKEKIQAAQEAYNSLPEDCPRATRYEASQALKAAKQELIAAITEGANPCPTCGAAPTGMQQEFVIRKVPIKGYEIGCPNCLNHSAIGIGQPGALARWNEGVDGMLKPDKAREYADALRETGGNHDLAAMLVRKRAA